MITQESALLNLALETPPTDCSPILTFNYVGIGLWEATPVRGDLARRSKYRWQIRVEYDGLFAAQIGEFSCHLIAWVRMNERKGIPTFEMAVDWCDDQERQQYQTEAKPASA
jgi:hypothetical protein